jgi:hypothetical protein
LTAPDEFRERAGTRRAQFPFDEIFDARAIGPIDEEHAERMPGRHELARNRRHYAAAVDGAERRRRAAMGDAAQGAHAEGDGVVARLAAGIGDESNAAGVVAHGHGFIAEPVG